MALHIANTAAAHTNRSWEAPHFIRDCLARHSNRGCMALTPPPPKHPHTHRKRRQHRVTALSQRRACVWTGRGLYVGHGNISHGSQPHQNPFKWPALQGTALWWAGASLRGMAQPLLPCLPTDNGLTFLRGIVCPTRRANNPITHPHSTHLGDVPDLIPRQRRPDNARYDSVTSGGHVLGQACLEKT